MKHIKLGRTGLDVSRLCLGCMSYGVPERGAHPWTLGEAQSRPFVKRALDLGINFFDTANTYSDGTSEEIVGRALTDYARREELVIATKVCIRMRKGPNGAGLSRKAIMTEIDASLRRLGTDYVDLYQIHRWDYGTPIEETLEALHDVVKAGKARYIGASSMHAWQFAKALHVSERHGWTRFVTMQNYLNLLYREEEREMLPLCRDEGIGGRRYPETRFRAKGSDDRPDGSPPDPPDETRRLTWRRLRFPGGPVAARTLSASRNMAAVSGSEASTCCQGSRAGVPVRTTSSSDRTTRAPAASRREICPAMPWGSARVPTTRHTTSSVRSEARPCAVTSAMTSAKPATHSRCGKV